MPESQGSASGVSVREKNISESKKISLSENKPLVESTAHVLDVHFETIN